MTLAALVDASGYSTAIQQKYQGMLVTETKLDIGGSALPPGQYGFGFTADGKFVVMDVANNEVLNTTSQTDAGTEAPRAFEIGGRGRRLQAVRRQKVGSNQNGVAAVGVSLLGRKLKAKSLRAKSSLVRQRLKRSHECRNPRALAQLR